MKFLERTLFFLHFCIVSSTKTISEIDVPHLQHLASHLSLSECTTIAHYDVNYVPSDEEGRQSGHEDCFDKLVKWVCQLRTTGKHTFPIVRDALKDIGRDDLIISLETLSRSPVSSKVVRDVHSVGEAQDYEESVSEARPVKPKEETNSEKSVDKSNPPSGEDEASGGKGIAHTAIRITIRTAGIVLVSTIILSCCCTLCVRRKLVGLCDRLFKRDKKPKSKFISVDTDDERTASKRVQTRKERKKRKRAPSYEIVHGTAQNENVAPNTEPKDDSEEQATECYRCYRKKRRKAAKKPKR